MGTQWSPLLISLAGHWVLLQTWGEKWPLRLATTGPTAEGAPLSLP